VTRIGHSVIIGLLLGLIASTSANATSLIINGSFDIPHIGAVGLLHNG
jgi:hypothetical protein